MSWIRNAFHYLFLYSSAYYIAHQLPSKTLVIELYYIKMDTIHEASYRAITLFIKFIFYL